MPLDITRVPDEDLGLFKSVIVSAKAMREGYIVVPQIEQDGKDEKSLRRGILNTLQWFRKLTRR